ncbi:MAG: hypothetical protein P1V51_10115 [Deltaproteobacteria bacterium]|nr:hypothetical protein [Deltaproteobacteria bacterium]
MSRLTIGRGLTVLVPTPGQPPLPLVRLIAHILFDESVEPPPDLVAPGAEASRAGLTLQDAGGRVYRILRDLKRGSVQLLVLDPATQQFNPVSTRAAEVGQYLRSQAQVPALDLIEGLFSLQASDSPSRRPLAAAAPEPASASSPFGGLAGRTATPPGGLPAKRSLPPSDAHFPGFTGGLDAGPAAGGGTGLGMSREELEKRIAELEVQATALAEVDQVQFELDGLQQKVDAIDQQLSSVKELEARLEELDRQLERFGDLSALPEDFGSKVAGFAASKDRLDRALERIEVERGSFEEHAAVPGEPLQRNRIFLGGLAGGLVPFGLSIAVDVRSLALLAPIGLGAAAFGLLRHFDGQEDHAGLGRRIAALDERAEKARRTFELETSLVRRTMEQVGAESPEELVARLGKREQALQARHAADAQLAAKRDSPEAQASMAERGRHSVRIAELEGKLAGAGGFVQDPADLRREIEGLKAELARMEGGGVSLELGGPPTGGYGATPPGQPGFGSLGGGSFGATSPLMGGPSEAPSAEVAAPPNPGPELLSLLSDVLHRPIEELLGAVGPRLSQYVAALSQGRWRGASFVGKADLQIDEATGPSLDWASLSPADRDLAYLGLRLTVAELAVRQSATPFVLDEPLLGSAPQGLVMKMLAALGGVTQILLQSSDPAWQQAATTVHPLGS